MPIIDEQQEQEAARRAKFVYEIMIGEFYYKLILEDEWLDLEAKVSLFIK